MRKPAALSSKNSGTLGPEIRPQRNGHRKKTRWVLPFAVAL